ncbi:hypothetical protein BIU98_07390 [Curtobacterium sp. MMLR14_010]|uniref:hypothetical protein n=1 Tax=Curtobacterium sp. MMLR14_010 TaxID=1898743 RepID=UPI0008DDAB36|nr:hypothetical protein [Curtobacterium sp. MMLR14_010]OII31594.1 hypothetical protein BIU98_07390 [Curtobacterium sp. MMLR14_010]
MADVYSFTEMQILETLGRLITVSDSQSPPRSVAAQHGTVPDASPGQHEQARAHITELKARGFLVASDRYTGGFYVTDSGRAAWASLDALRSNSVARRKQMRNEYLAWIYAQIEEGNGHSPVSSNFLSSGASFYGAAYTEDDLGRVGAWLEENGFIRGAGSWANSGPIRPDITAKGSRYVEEGIDVHTSPQALHGGGVSPQYHVTVSGSGTANIAQGSHHVSQTSNVGWQGDALALIETINARLQQVQNAPEFEELRTAVAELHDAANSNAEPGVVRRIAGKIVAALTTAAGAQLGTELVQQSVEFLTSLP